MGGCVVSWIPLLTTKLIDCVSLSSIQEEEEEEKGTIWLLLYFNFLTLSQNCLEDKMLSC
jgi:hypothetical protein